MTCTPAFLHEGKRYNSYNDYFRGTFGERVQKLSIDAGFTCPNRDGTSGLGGCTYCNNDAFNPAYCQPQKPVMQQIAEGIAFHKVRYRRAMKYLAYFQAYSNTYAPLHHLKSLYNEALSHPDIIGLVIGTRPDCIDKEKLDYFAQLAEKYYVIIEYGIESTNEETLVRINRGHTFSQSVSAINATTAAGIKTGAHFIFGLPGESRDEMLNQVTEINKLPLTTIKFHQLQIVKNTVMAQEFKLKPLSFNLFSLNDYINFVADFTERLNPNFVIERFSGEVPPRYLINEPWSKLRADEVTRLIINTLEARNSWQGKNYKTT